MNDQDSDFINFEEELLNFVLDSRTDHIVYVAQLDEYLTKLNGCSLNKIICAVFDDSELRVSELTYKLFIKEYISQIIGFLAMKCDEASMIDHMMCDAIAEIGDEVLVDEVQGDIQVETNLPSINYMLRVNPETEKLRAFDYSYKNVMQCLVDDSLEYFNR
jgi:hypothetical protein